MITTIEDTTPELVAAYADLEHALDRIAAASSTSLTETDLLDVAATHHQLSRRLDHQGLLRTGEIGERRAYARDGYPNLAKYVAGALRITRPGVHIRLMDAIYAHTELSGQVLPVRLPETAAVIAQGATTLDHVDVINKTIARIPSGIDPETTSLLEAQLAEYSREYTPRELARLGNRALMHLDPDGSFDDRLREASRSLKLQAQDPNRALMSRLTADLDPVTRSMLDVVLAKWAAPGMNNPEDPNSPRGSIGDVDVDTAVLKAAAERDERTTSQRNHDAFNALLRAALDGGVLGKSHRGVTPHLIVTISESALREHASLGITTSGTDLPIHDVVELAAKASPHLAVFKDHTQEVLHFGTARRLASPAQRLALFARDRGCTAPACSTPFIHTEAHHVTDYAKGGRTDIDQLTAACGPHNRAASAIENNLHSIVERFGPDTGRIIWGAPARDGETRKYRINRIHHPDIDVDWVAPRPARSDE